MSRLDTLLCTRCQVLEPGCPQLQQLKQNQKDYINIIKHLSSSVKAYTCPAAPRQCLCEKFHIFCNGRITYLAEGQM